MHFCFLYSLSDHSNIIPALLGPKIDEVKVELGIFDIHIFWVYERGA